MSEKKKEEKKEKRKNRSKERKNSLKEDEINGTNIHIISSEDEISSSETEGDIKKSKIFLSFNYFNDKNSTIKLINNTRRRRYTKNDYFINR